MSSSPLSPVPPSKSKKLSSSSTPKSKPPNPPAITTQTPTQSSQLPPRLRKRRVALSLKEVRQIASQDGSHRNKPDCALKSVRRQIASWPDDSTITKKQKRRNKSHDGSAKIPDKYEMLGEFFDNLDSSIKLLRMKGSMCSFTNISPKIESLTDRRFSHKHLAQMKYILPEAIEIKRVINFDERTSCMRPDLHITLNFDAIECDGNSKSESKNMFLRKVFRARLADFYKAHPQGDDIPVGMLPEPFNRSKQDLSSDTTKAPTTSSSIEASAYKHAGHMLMETGALEEQPVMASHISQTFQRRFSQKVAKIEPENILQKTVSSISGPCPNKTSSNEEISSSVCSPVKVSSEHTCGRKRLSASPRKDICPMDGRKDSPIKMASIQSTPSKLTLTPASMTPALHPQKRCFMSPDDDSSSSTNKLVRRPPHRSLIFDTPMKNAEVKQDETVDVSDDDDVLKILPESLLQSIREKERKAKEEQDPAISQAKRRRQMIACLPKLFNMIHFLFQSMKQSVITKEELMHKIIAGHADIVDSKEVEEQLDLLVELVPEWISEKLASSGDLLLRINKMSSPETVRARLEEANINKMSSPEAALSIRRVK